MHSTHEVRAGGSFCRWLVPGEFGRRSRRAGRGAAWVLAGAVALAASGVGTAWGDIVGSGDVFPVDPSEWTTTTWLFVGQYSVGSATVNGGSTLVIPGRTAIGLNNGSSGTVLVDGSGSTWTCGSAWVGEYGTGMLSITNGGVMNNGGPILGKYAGSSGTATVDGSGSTWNSGGSLTIGEAGAGTLNIAHGGVVSVSGTTFIASGTSSTGIINFGPGGGTLTTKGLYGSPAQFTGDAFVATRGIVGDGVLVLDGAYGQNQTASWVLGTQSVTVRVDLSGGGAGVDWGFGYRGMGALTLRNGFVIASPKGNLGLNAGSNGTATVDGSGTAWNCSGSLTVGSFGAGTLNVTNGGKVSNTYGYVGNSAGAVGNVSVSGSGSSWTCSGVLYVGNSGVGTLSIANGGSVSSATTWVGNATGSTGAVSVDGSGSTWACSGSLTVGFFGTGTLSVTNGAHVSNTTGMLGYLRGISGQATIDGSGSTWTCSGSLTVGYGGWGTLTITNGGQVSNGNGYVGASSSLGVVKVDGSGSTWACSGSLTGGGSLTISHGGVVTAGSASLGVLSITGGGKLSGATIPFLPVNMGIVSVDGNGSSWASSGMLLPRTLTISGGGLVTAGSLGLSSGSLLMMTVGDNSLLNLNAGRVALGGVMKLRAAPMAAAGVYTPIVAGTWTGSATVTTLGGSWSTSSHQFTMTDAASGTVGELVRLDTLTTPRVVITDPTSGDAVGASFQVATSSTILNIRAWGLSDPQTAQLESGLPAGSSVLDGWNFSTTGYVAGNPVFLSMKVGAGRAVGDMTVWHYDGTAWAAYAAGDLTYDGTYASFTVNGFSGYAVTAVPEPGGLALLGVGAVGVLVRRRGVRGGLRRRGVG